MRALGPGSRLLLQLGRRGGRGGDQAGAPRRDGRAAGRPSTASCASRAPSTAARWRRSRPAGRPPSASRSSPCRPASSTSRATTSTRSRPRSGPETCAVLVEPIQGEGGVWPIDPDWLAARARALRPPRRAAALRRGADGHRPLRRVVLRRARAACGPTRSRSRRDSPAASRSARCWPRTMPDAGFERGDHATTFGGSPADRGSRAGRARCDRARGPGRERPRASASTSPRAPAALPGVDHVRGAGLLLGIELADAPAAEVAEALRARGILVNAITPTRAAPRAATVPLAGRGRPFLCHVRGCAGRPSRPACHHSGISPRCARIPVLESGRKRLSPAVFPPTAKGADAYAHRLFRRRPGGPWTRRGRAHRGHQLG